MPPIVLCSLTGLHFTKRWCRMPILGIRPEYLGHSLCSCIVSLKLVLSLLYKLIFLASKLSTRGLKRVVPWRLVFFFAIRLTLTTHSSQAGTSCPGFSILIRYECEIVEHCSVCRRFVSVASQRLFQGATSLICCWKYSDRPHPAPGCMEGWGTTVLSTS